MKHLQRHYAGSHHEYLFVDTFAEISEQMVGTNKIQDAVDHVMQKLTTLEQQAVPSVAHMLSLYMDMFIPLILYMETSGTETSDEALCTDNGDGAPIETYMPNKCFHSGLLPNHVSKLMMCSFWSDEGKQEPIVHLLSKSTPQRCQIRSLSHIVYNYSRLHDEVFHFLVNCLKCSLMGVYRGVARPDFATRKRLHTVFDHMDKHTFLLWMKEGHQQLLFFIMKEYLVFAAQCLPSLRTELMDRYNWSQFETTVTDAMNKVRTTTTDMQFAGIENLLLSVNKSQTNLYRPIKHPFVYFVLQEFEREDDINCVMDTNIDHTHIRLVYDMLQRVPRGPLPFEWLEYFGTPQAVWEQAQRVQAQMEDDGIKLPLRTFITSLTPTTKSALRCIAIAYEMHNNIRMFTLPVHTTVEQVRALRQLHNVPDGDEAPDMGRGLVCIQCKKFKGFVAHMKAGKAVNLFAYGHSKVLIDYATGGMHCGRKCDKVDKKREINAEFEPQSVTTAREVKRIAKEYRKDVRNKLCASTELMQVPLLGNILQFYGNIFTVCPQCGSFMKYDPKQMYNGMYCGCCIKDGKRIGEIQCTRCGDRQHLGDPIMVTSGESIYLCKQHYKPWIREATAVLDKATILRGLEEKWKRLQSI